MLSAYKVRPELDEQLRSLMKNSYCSRLTDNSVLFSITVSVVNLNLL